MILIHYIIIRIKYEFEVLIIIAYRNNQKFFKIFCTFIIFIFMEQRYCIIILKREGCNASEILQKLQEWYGPEALHKTQVYFWIAKLNLGRTDLNDLPIPGRPKESYIDDEISAAVRINPFASCRQIASMVQTSGATVYRRLTDMGYKNLLLKWVPHKLNEYQKQLRLSTAKGMLQKLNYLKKDHFQYIFTDDESWYQYYYDFERQWVLDSDKLNERVEKTNYEKKTMIIIFIGVNGLVLLKTKPVNQSINGEYYVKNILKPLETILDADHAKKKKEGNICSFR